MFRFCLFLAALLAFLASGPAPAPAAEGSTDLLAQTCAQVLILADEIYQDHQLGRKTPEALRQVPPLLRGQLEDLRDQIDRELLRPDLGPSARRALHLARRLVGRLIELMDVLQRLLQGEDDPGLKKTYARLRDQARAELSQLQDLSAPGARI